MHLYSLNHDKTNIDNQKYDIFIKPKGITLVSPCRLGECCTTQGAKSSELIVLPPAVNLFFLQNVKQNYLPTGRVSLLPASVCNF